MRAPFKHSENQKIIEIVSLIATQVMAVQICINYFPVQLYSLLSFVAPNLFPLTKMEHFLTSFSDLKGGRYSYKYVCVRYRLIVTMADDEDAKTLHSVLEPFLLRRTKNEVS